MHLASSSSSSSSSAFFGCFLTLSLPGYIQPECTLFLAIICLKLLISCNQKRKKERKITQLYFFFFSSNISNIYHKKPASSSSSSSSFFLIMFYQMCLALAERLPVFFLRQPILIQCCVSCK